MNELLRYTPTGHPIRSWRVHDDPQLKRYFKRVLLMTKHSERVGEVLSAGQLESLWREGFNQQERALIWNS